MNFHSHKKSPIVIGLFVVSCLAIAESQAATIKTTDGTGGISGLIQQDQASDAAGNFGGGQFHVKNASQASITRKGYLRFDTSTISSTVTAVSLDLVVSLIDSGIAATNQVINVYGLTNQALDNWVPSTTNWTNAPGNDTTSKFEGDAASTSFLGSFTLSFNGSNPSPVGTVVQFSDQRLLDFINADTNGQVTFLLGRVGNPSSSSNLLFAGDTNASFEPPTLTFEVVPEPSSLMLLGIGGLLAFRRRR